VSPVPRVVSLVPSVTETLLGWGITPVAVTRFCEQPSLRAVGGTKDPDIAAIVELAPDLVVLCEEENRIEDAERLAAEGLRLHTVTVRAVDHVGPELAQLANVVGAGAGVVGEVEPVPPADGGVVARLRAFVPIWRRPWMTLNHETYGSSLLASLGVDNVFSDEEDRYPVTDLPDAAARAPDVVLLPTEPYPFKQRHVPELEEAVAPVELVDGQDLFWWGVRTPEAYRRLARVVDGLVTRLG
jgi:ABC-type Fe3+-hydroxamate transport system substrate-binding protein